MTSSLLPVLFILLVVFVGAVAALCWYIRRLADATLALQGAAAEFRRHVEQRLDDQADKLHILETRVRATVPS